MTFRNFHWLDLTKYAVTLLRQITGGIEINLFHDIPVVAKSTNQLANLTADLPEWHNHLSIIKETRLRPDIVIRSGVSSLKTLLLGSPVCFFKLLGQHRNKDIFSDFLLPC